VGKNYIIQVKQREDYAVSNLLLMNVKYEHLHPQ